MKLLILGSGGFQTIPRPLCGCKVCTEARKKGVPYTRNGPSLYVFDLKLIVDTPKDIINSINRESIKYIEKICYTHWHPDHTEGMRLVEEITSEWSKGQKAAKLMNHNKPITICAPPGVLAEIKQIRSPLGSYMEFFKSKNFIKFRELLYDQKVGDKISLRAIKVKESKLGAVCAYLFEEQLKKVLYFPCDVKPSEISKDVFSNLDVLIVNSPYLESNLGIKKIAKSHPLNEDVFSLDEILELIKKYKIKKTIITHIEEMWRHSFDDYKKLEQKYSAFNLKFGYDGMIINV